MKTPENPFVNVAIFTYFAVGGIRQAYRGARRLPEVAVERSRGLCGAGHELRSIVHEIERTAQAHQMARRGRRNDGHGRGRLPEAVCATWTTR